MLNDPGHESMERSKEEAAPAGGAPPKVRILLVEDHEDTLEVMCRFLEMRGHVVRGATNVAEGLELAEKEPFDLLVSDLNLPDGTGFDLMQKLKSAGHDLRGIALSGDSMEEHLGESTSAGYVEYLQKPIDFNRLEVAIARHAGHAG